MKTVGAMLVGLGGLLCGLAVAGRLRSRARALRQLERTLALAFYAIGRFRLSTPALVRELAQSAPGAGGALFARVAALWEREDKPLGEIWRAALDGVPEQAKPALLAFGQVLGRYGAGEQTAAAERCRAELDRLAVCAENETARSGRVYVAVGAAAGCMAAIVML